MISPAIRYTGTGRRFTKRLTTKKQRDELAKLALKVGLDEVPNPFWSHQAQEVIERLERVVRQPMLEGFSS